MTPRSPTIPPLALALFSLLMIALSAGPAWAGGLPEVPTEPDALDAWLAASEAQIPDLREGVEKTIVWADPAHKGKTPLSIVYLHGFTATRQECAPLSDDLAAQLGANLFYTRLRGHGRSGESLVEGTRATWKEDTLEALAVGEAIGEEVIIIGLSTGATLGTWLGSIPEGQDVLANVFISPNYRVLAAGAGLLALPGGRWIARVAAGKERDWTDSAPPEQVRYWTTRYPSRALVPMARLVRQVDRLNLAKVTTPTLILYSPRDQVVDPEATLKAFAELGSDKKEIHAIESSEAASQHVLTGRILSPGNLGEVRGLIYGFLEGVGVE